MEDYVRGLAIRVHKTKDLKEIQRISRGESILVAFTGLANKGKSHFTRLLSGRKIPTGLDKKTEGFCIIYDDRGNDEMKFTYLDTKGFG
jgi:hypothetical protein